MNARHTAAATAVWQASLKEVPAHLHDGLINYLVHHRPVGSFLMAALSNDLVGAIRGNDASVAGLPALVRFLVHQVPSEAWGSPDTVAAWLERRRSA